MKHILSLIGAMATLWSTAQSISPSVIGSAGTSGTVGGTTFSWTVGETAITTLDNGSNRITQGFHQADPVRLKLNIRAFLQGPFNSVSGAMNDGLRANGLVPLTEPYTDLGYTFLGGGGESTTQPVLDLTGDHAIIDWVLLELREKNDNTNILYSRSALLQANGSIVDPDGPTPLRFPVPADDYYIVVLHRNHLGVMTLNPVSLSSATTVLDLTDGSAATYGTEAQQTLANTSMLWAGDVTFDGTIKYTGQDNDRDPILTAIGGTVPTNTVSGYNAEDVNMDGTVKYTGQDNDRDPILQNIGGVVPTNVRVEQMP